MSTFKSVVTDLGQARIAAAIQSGQDINITQMAVGDGGGSATVPVSTQTKLVKETYRIKLNSLKTDSKHANWIIAEAIIPASVGGFWMREMGLYAADGTLIAVSNMADTYKPTLEEGSGRTQTLRMVIVVTNTDAVSLTIDDSLIVATEEYVNDLLADHEASRRHPDGTLTAKGFVQLSNAVDSTSEVLAATPKAVKVANDLAKSANDNANGRLPSAGTAVAATRLATARKIAGVPFDGTADINLGVTNITGLGTAATRDVGTVDGNVMQVGAFGLGATAAPVFTDASAINTSGFFRIGSSGIHGPVYEAPAEIIQCQYDANAAHQIAWRTGTLNGPMYHRSKINGAWGGEWLPVIDKNGGTLQGDYAPLVLQQKTDNNALIIMARNSTGGNIWSLGKAAVNSNTVQLINYKDNTSLQLAATATITAPLKITGNLEIATAAPIIQLSESDTGKKYFIVADARGFRIDQDSTSGTSLIHWDGKSYVLKVGGQIAPTSYANFDARYGLKTAVVTGVRLSGRTRISTGGDNNAPSGCVFVMIGDFGADNGYGDYSAVQQCINGNWYTIASV
ncbi:tail fiber protein gp37 [Rahnella sp. BIGb0236]|uniref:phage tail protein n=1 Tax=Rahnella sp. BIGb0236 TaxID=2485117 RepID=UPI00105FBF01|nr:phage tail protein [Rahnella sp. BIGb0236]TDS90541.1 tail fiber protein gp37 [Rahnella sp. BIGb0236]VTQ57485.1 tail fiber protein H [Campylobacter jejuni]